MGMARMMTEEELAARASADAPASVAVSLAQVVEVAERCGKYEATLWEISRLLRAHSKDPAEAMKQINLVGRDMLNRGDWGS